MDVMLSEEHKSSKPTNYVAYTILKLSQNEIDDFINNK